MAHFLALNTGRQQQWSFHWKTPSVLGFCSHRVIPGYLVFKSDSQTYRAVISKIFISPLKLTRMDSVVCKVRFTHFPCIKSCLSDSGNKCMDSAERLPVFKSWLQCFFFCDLSSLLIPCLNSFCKMGTIMGLELWFSR